MADPGIILVQLIEFSLLEKQDTVEVLGFNLPELQLFPLVSDKEKKKRRTSKGLKSLQAALGM